MDNTSQPDLSLVPTDELSRELLRRCDHGAVVMLFEQMKVNTNAYKRHWKGSSHTVTGLLHDCAFRVLEEMSLREKSGDYLGE